MSRYSRWAHPRSRGENSPYPWPPTTSWGSSPLTRGKLDHSRGHGGGQGLIPAHAGKTIRCSSSRTECGAHPRSRGENSRRPRVLRAVVGSSPLTRGKHPDDGADGGGLGLIPAHAGKTQPTRKTRPWPRAHPRSRGENDPFKMASAARLGSSPLTRGKHHQRAEAATRLGLIPAHAGKTLPDLRFYRADRSDLGKP